MKADRLEYEGFRNLKAGEFRPSEGVNIVYGDNGQGKTNLLEALWLFTGGRSFRGARDGEMKGFAADKAALRLEFTAEDRAQEAAITIQKRRAASIGGIPQPSPSRLAGRFCAVVFSPAHLSLIKDGPEERRRFLDAAYCQLRPGYIASLSEYSRTLAQRNALLKNARQTDARPGELLDVWDDRLARIGARLLLARRAYVRKIQPVAAAIYDGLSAGRESFSIAMHDDGGEDGMDSGQAAARLLERLRETRYADLAAGFTTAGPHRADLLVQIRGLSARSYGSQGQQRSAVLALKLAEASVLREVTGEQPVALLDDVMSELDLSRQDYILNHIHDWQVFITCCDPGAVRRLDGGRAFRMQDGILTPDG